MTRQHVLRISKLKQSRVFNLFLVALFFISSMVTPASASWFWEEEQTQDYVLLLPERTQKKHVKSFVGSITKQKDIKVKAYYEHSKAALVRAKNSAIQQISKVNLATFIPDKPVRSSLAVVESSRTEKEDQFEVTLQVEEQYPRASSISDALNEIEKLGKNVQQPNSEGIVILGVSRRLGERSHNVMNTALVRAAGDQLPATVFNGRKLKHLNIRKALDGYSTNVSAGALSKFQNGESAGENRLFEQEKRQKQKQEQKKKLSTLSKLMYTATQLISVAPAGVKIWMGSFFTISGFSAGPAGIPAMAGGVAMLSWGVSDISMAGKNIWDLWAYGEAPDSSSALGYGTGKIAQLFTNDKTLQKHFRSVGDLVDAGIMFAIFGPAAFGGNSGSEVFSGLMALGLSAIAAVRGIQSFLQSLGPDDNLDGDEEDQASKEETIPSVNRNDGSSLRWFAK